MGPTITKPGVLRQFEAFPILTEDVGAAQRAAVSTPATAGGSIANIANKVVAEVLGWKIKDGDTKGFIGALTQSFTLTDVEGHVEATWKPRSYAVQTDLSGGITGAQASIYSRAKEAMDQALPLLDGLYTLDPEADPEDVEALKAVARSQIREMVAELALLGGPRVSRVNQYFALLLGPAYPANPAQAAQVAPTDPDQIGGTLGNLRDVLGLNFTGQDFVNTVGDEQDLSNYRILSDYITSLAQSWLNNLGFFGLDSTTPFFGTQLVLLSRQLSVVAEQVDEVRFTLNSVFITAAERQMLRINFSTTEPAMFAEELFTWIQSFATEEGPRLIQDGGKFAVQNTFLPVSARLANLVRLAQTANNPLNAGLPPGYQTVRVQVALEQLEDELDELVNLSQPIRHLVTTEPDFALPLTVSGTDPDGVSATDLAALANSTPNLLLRVRILGSGFEAPPDAVKIGDVTATHVFFRSESSLVALFDPTQFRIGAFTVSVRNPDGSPPATLPGGFTVTT